MLHHPQPQRDPRQATLSLAGAAALAVVLFAGAVLWHRFGEAIYLDRLLTTIANCF